MMARSLIIVPEMHRQKKEAEAAALAKKLRAGARGTIKLFVEGVRRCQTMEASESLGFPVTSIEDDAIKRFTTILSAAMAMTRCNAFFFALWHREEPGPAEMLSGIATTTAEVNGVLPGGAVTFDDMAKAVVSDTSYSVEPLISSGMLSEAGYGDLMVDIFANGRTGVSPRLSSLLHSLAEEAAEIEVRKVALELSGRVSDFFHREYGVRIRIGESDDTITGVFDALDGHDPMSLHESADRSYRALRLCRESYIAYSIAREPFDIGVLNIGLGHVRNGHLVGLLEATDIADIVEIGKG